ncbi:hypothetical protein [Nocardioides campestrisoli]|uniref:hypothetical protein n=1 Tax=Nocardioides campestrisoli TaxID=2736757 RepID=UPI0015E62CFC|nr:hypothetical protein [Nocardioides campestrisoli]
MTLTDRRGARAEKRTYQSRVFRVRTTGRATFRFRPTARCGSEDDPVLIRLMKVRGHRIAVDGKPVRLRKPRPGFYAVAWIRVPRTGRVRLTGRNAGGRQIDADLMLVGDELSGLDDDGVSVEHGLPLNRLPWDYTDDDHPALRHGTRAGLTFRSRARVEALSALTHTVELDGPPVTLASGGGREHVLTVRLPEGVETYLDAETEWWAPGFQYWLADGPGYPAKAGTYRLVVASRADAPYAERSLRVRAYRDAPDLVVGGPPVRLESAEPGQRFRMRVLASAAGAVRLAASDVTVQGGGWFAGVSRTCGRDCYGGVSVNAENPVATGAVVDPAHARAELVLEHGASGGVTLTLTPESS